MQLTWYSYGSKPKVTMYWTHNADGEKRNACTTFGEVGRCLWKWPSEEQEGDVRTVLNVP